MDDAIDSGDLSRRILAWATSLGYGNLPRRGRDLVYEPPQCTSADHVVRGPQWEGLGRLQSMAGTFHEVGKVGQL